MSLPPAFFDELRSRLSLAQVVGRKVIWDMRKSNQAKGDWWAPCPFHQEKSASFHVDDRKGFYYCFGCHAKGDMISFVRETENAGFMEAIEILAREAGLPMLARDPRAAAVADRRTQLTAVMDEAVKWLRLQLKTAGASDARAYLAKRGLTPDAIDRWDIGYAPDTRQGLFTALTAKGISPDLIVAAGLCATPDDGGPPYDRFRGRIIFPIRDARGRAISLGGRAMDPNARAKYLNGPETDLFDKGRNLYNLARARDAVGKGARLILAEGYMDVIALSEAGFGGAVAPLGTAVTEDQLRLMWRVAPEPIVALDGDKAGIRAGLRVVDLALPLLEAGQSLRFALLPEGQDPDDLIRAQGAGAMQAVLEAAKPVVDLLWAREIEGQVFDSPERRAMLDRALRARLAAIRDPSLRAHYAEALRDKRAALFGTRRPTPAQGGARRPWVAQGWVKGAAPPLLPPSQTARASALVADPAAADVLREAVVLATCLVMPALVAEFEPELDRMECRLPEHAAVRDTILRLGARPDLRSATQAALGDGPLARLFARPHVAICPTVRHPDDLDKGRMTLAEELAKLRAERGRLAEIAEAEAELLDPALSDEAERLTRRLRDAAATAAAAQRSQSEDRAEYDTAPNGARIKRDESAALARLISGITAEKPQS